MPLQFNPPEWLIKDYLSRKQPAEIASEGVGSAIDSYAQMKQQQQAQQFQKQQLASQDAQRKAAEFKAVADYVPEDQLPALAAQYGINLPTAKAPMATSSLMPTPNEQMAQQSLPAEHPMSGGSPIIDHWNQTMGQDAVGGQPPIPPGKPTTPAGKKRYHADLANQKLEQDLAGKGPLQTLTKEQALSNGTFDPSKQVMVEPPAPRLDLGTKQDQFDQKEWDKIVKDTNPLTASSRSTLGMASKANFQADRALVTLSKPVVTNQEAGNVMADIAAIYQTGSPTQYGMSHQEYSTLYGKIQGALQSVTGKPQDALPNAIKSRLVGVLHDMKGTNSLVLKQQLDFTERSKKRIIDKFPDEWKGIRSTLEDNPDMPGQNIPVISDDAAFKSLPSGSQFKDPSGQLHTKR